MDKIQDVGTDPMVMAVGHDESTMPATRQNLPQVEILYIFSPRCDRHLGVFDTPERCKCLSASAEIHMGPFEDDQLAIKGRH